MERHRRWMLFLDGENFTLRAEECAKVEGVTLTQGPYYQPKKFVWMPGADPERFWYYCVRPGEKPSWTLSLQDRGVRAHYYTTVVGSEETLKDVRAELRTLGFSAHVFKKDAQTGKTKGVDVTLTKDVLSHAYQDNYDAAFLVAGDGDYVPLVDEVQRQGKIVYVAFFEGGPAMGLSGDLKVAADRFVPLNHIFSVVWRDHLRLTNP